MLCSAQPVREVFVIQMPQYGRASSIMLTVSGHKVEGKQINEVFSHATTAAGDQIAVNIQQALTNQIAWRDVHSRQKARFIVGEISAPLKPSLFRVGELATCTLTNPQNAPTLRFASVDACLRHLYCYNSDNSPVYRGCPVRLRPLAAVF